jgi:hypothetical protein
MAGTLKVLPGAVDEDGDAAEVLQTADIDRGRWIVATLGEPDARHAVEDVGQAARLRLGDLLLAQTFYDLNIE